MEKHGKTMKNSQKLTKSSGRYENNWEDMGKIGGIWRIFGTKWTHLGEGITNIGIHLVLI
jgi:hypothetical protein